MFVASKSQTVGQVLLLLFFGENCPDDKERKKERKKKKKKMKKKKTKTKQNKPKTNQKRRRRRRSSKKCKRTRKAFSLSLCKTSVKSVVTFCPLKLISFPQITCSNDFFIRLFFFFYICGLCYLLVRSFPFLLRLLFAA